MIRLVAAAVAFAFIGSATVVSAADVPFSVLQQKPAPHKPAAKLKKQAQKSPRKQIIRDAKITEAEPKQQAVVAPLPTQQEISLTWVLDPLVANADNAKKEGSASAEANLVVTEPGQTISTEVQVELSGHVVKTAQTTARIDVRVDGTNHSFSWPADEVKAGRFTKSFKTKLSGAKLPAYIPVSAIALVTKDGTTGAVLVSLEKIVLRIGSTAVAQSQ